jgi:hypothetical protein
MPHKAGQQNEALIEKRMATLDWQDSDINPISTGKTNLRCFQPASEMLAELSVSNSTFIR